MSGHVTVIGAGIVGISCAAFLQREGFRVTIIDKVPPGQGCSFGNAAGVVVSGVSPTVHPGILTKIPGWLLDPKGPLTIRWRHLPRALPWLLALGRSAMPDRVARITEARAALCLRALGDHQDVLAGAGASDLLVLEDGLHVYDTEAQYRADEKSRQTKRHYGYDPRRLSPGEMRELEPDLAGDLLCGVFHGGWYRVKNPYTVVTRLSEQVVRDGGTILQDEVVKLEHDGRRATRLHLRQAGEQAIDRLCVAAGAWSHEIARQLGSKVLLEAERGYHLTIPDPGVRLSRAVTHAAQPGAVTPLDDGIRIAGTDEFAGNDAAPDWRRADHLFSYGRRLLPGLRPLDASVSKWMGRRPGTPDSLPVIGRSPGLENVWYGFGHGHMGLSWGPTTGRLVAGLVAGKTPNMDLAAYRIDRTY